MFDPAEIGGLGSSPRAPLALDWCCVGSGDASPRLVGYHPQGWRAAQTPLAPNAPGPAKPEALETAQSPGLVPLGRTLPVLSPALGHAMVASFLGAGWLLGYSEGVIPPPGCAGWRLWGDPNTSGE